MMSISSQAGRRLARAKARLDGLDLAPECAPQQRQAALEEYDQARDELADELIDAGFADIEGDL